MNDFWSLIIVLSPIILLTMIFALPECKNWKYKHRYKKISWREEVDHQRFERYSVRTYKCIDCDKTVEIDGRNDHIDKHQVY